jgi:hypothetical protein
VSTQRKGTTPSEYLVSPSRGYSYAPMWNIFLAVTYSACVGELGPLPWGRVVRILPEPSALVLAQTQPHTCGARL